MTQTKLKSEQALGGNGWILADETWTYASVDAPTGVITVPTDATTKYSVGMKVKFTQTTVKYGIITAIAATSMTIYTGTDYTLANAAITANYYSNMKAPLGFPLDPDKWTVTVSDTTKRTQATPTSATWYNLNSTTISIPIGVWKVSYSVVVAPYSGSATSVNQFTTLSAANNTEDDKGFTSAVSVQQTTSGTTFFRSTVYREKTLTLAAKTSYYLNAMHNASNSEITFENGLGTMYLKAVSVYL